MGIKFSMSVARLYQFVIYEGDKKEFGTSWSIPNKDKKNWDVILKNPNELEERVISHAKNSGFNIKEQFKIGEVNSQIDVDLPYSLVFRNSQGIFREYSLKAESILSKKTERILSKKTKSLYHLSNSLL